MNRLIEVISVVLIFLIVSLAFLANHYRTTSTEFKRQRDEKTQALELANATINDMQTRQRDVAALDAKFTRELADAQKTISDLRRDVDSGAKRLRVAATCSHMRQTTQSSGVDDATGPELTGGASRNYFTLRERIETSGKMIAGLQEYINTQCLKGQR
ncbi:TPA: lysis protein [Klebsiella pneumoniae]|uniref:lysis protein n=1 Tax=Klebsiella pneumoniae TaxID=573 RepID=UPI0024AEFF01|nr:lysis protein [Klebsiella pneumoniae]MDI7146341.1 lysis protein [Klebsiella pneumoniae]HBQ6681681.1 lysis protein [Klebsiella pneumoniae]